MTTTLDTSTILQQETSMELAKKLKLEQENQAIQDAVDLWKDIPRIYALSDKDMEKTMNTIIDGFSREVVITTDKNKQYIVTATDKMKIYVSTLQKFIDIRAIRPIWADNKQSLFINILKTSTQTLNEKIRLEGKTKEDTVTALGWVVPPSTRSTVILPAIDQPIEKNLGTPVTMPDADTVGWDISRSSSTPIVETPDSVAEPVVVGKITTLKPIVATPLSIAPTTEPIVKTPDSAVSSTDSPEAPKSTTHTVISKDTLYRIAWWDYAMIQEIVRVNKGKYRNISPWYIQAGWVLEIPGKVDTIEPLLKKISPSKSERTEPSRRIENIKEKQYQ
jgi:LysM repeat protein